LGSTGRRINKVKASLGKVGEALAQKQKYKQNAWRQWLTPGYLGSRDREDCGSRPIQASSSRDPMFKINKAKWTGVWLNW
jgi:hypothetical protein